MSRNDAVPDEPKNYGVCRSFFGTMIVFTFAAVSTLALMFSKKSY